MKQMEIIKLFSEYPDETVVTMKILRNILPVDENICDKQTQQLKGKQKQKN